MAEILVFVVDDVDASRRAISQRINKSWGFRTRVFSSDDEVLEALNDYPDAIILSDFNQKADGIEILRKVSERAPNIPVIMLLETEEESTVTTIVRLGVTDYLPRPIDYQRLKMTLRNAISFSKVRKELLLIRESIERTVSNDVFIAGCREMQLVMHMIDQVKDTDITVFITGENGSGKELTARKIHFSGNRKNGPFIAVNCAAIPPDMLEGELFGYERVAFAGAQQRKIGKFEQANGGTLFLDDIGDLTLALQSKVLHALSLREFERVGSSTHVLKHNARVVAACNRNLKEAVKRKQFREDLFYRLTSLPIHLPALRLRGSDIIELAELFLTQFSKEMALPVKGFSHEAIEVLYRYPWPGNVRELKNAIRRAVTLAGGELISTKELPAVTQPFLHSSMELAVDGKIFPDTTIMPLEQIREMVVRRAIEITNGNLALTARKLGISRSTLYKMTQKFKIKL